MERKGVGVMEFVFFLLLMVISLVPVAIAGAMIGLLIGLGQYFKHKSKGD
jgi:hypothetical protein